MLEKAYNAKGYIIESFLRLLAKKPYNSITVTDVVKKAGVARATFYRNYKSIDNLLNVTSSLLADTLNKNLSIILLEQDENKATETLTSFLKELSLLRPYLIKISRDNIGIIIDRINTNANIKETLLEKSNDDFKSKYNLITKIGIIDTVVKSWLSDHYKDDVELIAKFIVEKLKQIN